MQLTKTYIREQTNRALKDQNIKAEIKSIEWLGQRCKEKFGNAHFRVARVILETENKQVMRKLATIDTTGYFSIK